MVSSQAVNYPGSFITLEGPEGAGKTTQLKILSQRLESLNIPYTITRDPGGTPLGRQIRRILLKPGTFVSPMTELLLYQADRAQNVAEVIVPGLEQGHIVLCDRFIDSTLAYQGFGRNIDRTLIDQLNQMSTQGLKPELTILFDLESETGLGRLHPGGHDRLEQEAIEFHHNIRRGYHSLIEEDPKRWSVIDANKPLITVQEEFTKLLVERFSAKHPKLTGLLDKAPIRGLV